MKKRSGYPAAKDIKMESALTTRGHATIPKPVRERFGLKPGDRVKFFLHPDGSVVLLPKLPLHTLRGIMKPWRRATIDTMNEAIAAAAVEGATRHRRG